MVDWRKSRSEAQNKLIHQLFKVLTVFSALLLFLIIMTNHAIQTERMKGYFIQAASELIKGDGFHSISTRSVAERAGYSYATLYNYFKDLNDLIFECVKGFQKECELQVRSSTAGIPPGREKIKSICLAYMDYFVEYPGVFELFFIERMGHIGNRKTTAQTIYVFLDSLCEDEWNYCVRNNIYNEELVERLKPQLRSCVMGMLLFFENRHQPADYNDFVSLAGEQIDHILGQGQASLC